MKRKKNYNKVEKEEEVNNNDNDNKLKKKKNKRKENKKEKRERKKERMVLKALFLPICGNGGNESDDRFQLSIDDFSLDLEFDDSS